MYYGNIKLCFYRSMVKLSHPLKQKTDTLHL